MKNISLLITFILLVQSMAFGQTTAPEKIQKDSLQLGRASTGANKSLIFDTNDGASNKSILLNGTTKEFTLNSKVNVTGAVSAGGAISTTSGNISTASGNMSASGSITAASSDISGTARHQSGTTLGSGANASKQITVDRAGFDPFVKWNETAGKWTFSNDGSVEKNFGSGSGGDTGITVLTNGSFEDGLAVDWVSSGGTFSSQLYATPDPSGNDTIFARFIASGAGQYFETVAHAVPSNVFGGCLAKVNYNTTDTENWKLQVYDGSSNLLKETTLYAKTWMDGHAPFPCPTVGTLIKLRVISIAAGQIEADKGYLGKENRTFQVAQAQLAGESYFAGTASCLWSRTSTTLGAFTSSASCPGPTIASSSIGQWQTTDTDLPVQTINNLPAGSYRATFYITNYPAVGAFTSFAITDGTTTCSEQGGGGTATQESLTLSCVFNYATSGNRSFTVHGRSSSGVLYFDNRAGAGYSVGTKFQLEYYPNSSQTALVPEAQDWFIDVSIGGANPSIGASNISTYTEIQDSGLDMVTRDGSAAAKIPCSSTNASTGLTCSSGNESLGVVFTNPTPGWYEACYSTSLYHSGAANTGVNTTLQAIYTANASQTILAEGGDKTVSYSSVSSSTYVTVFPHKGCGQFFFSSVGEKTIRLMYEQSVSGVPNSSSMYGDRSAANGQRDIHIIVRPLLSAYNRPYLTGDQMTASINNTKECKFSWGGAGSLSSPSGCSATPCTTYLDTCSALTSTFTRTGTGDYSAPSSGWVPNTPVTCSSHTNGGDQAWPVMPYAADGSGNLTIRSRTGTPAVNTDRSAIMSCTGARL